MINHQARRVHVAATHAQSDVLPNLYLMRAIMYLMNIYIWICYVTGLRAQGIHVAAAQAPLAVTIPQVQHKRCYSNHDDHAIRIALYTVSESMQVHQVSMVISVHPTATDVLELVCARASCKASIQAASTAKPDCTRAFLAH